MNIVRSATRDWLGRSLVALLCAAFLVWAMPRKAQAVSAIEVGLIAALIAIANEVIPLPPSGSEQQVAFDSVLGQLKAAVNGADQALVDGNRPAEVSRISKAIGLTQALIGMTSSCDDCGALRSDLQQMIGLASALKSLALGVVATCNPDGIIEGNEQCDPLAVPTGCPTETLPTFCTDECQCQAVIP